MANWIFSIMIMAQENVPEQVITNWIHGALKGNIEQYYIKLVATVISEYQVLIYLQIGIQRTRTVNLRSIRQYLSQPPEKTDIVEIRRFQMLMP